MADSAAWQLVGEATAPLRGGVSGGSEGKSSEMPLSLAAGDQIGELGAESPEPRMEFRKSSESGPGRTCWDRDGG